MSSGIPQGTVRGPLLFIVYINDILDNVHSEGLLFVDDTKIFRAITKKDDAEALPLDIESLYQWLQLRGMEFNGEKCHVLTFGRMEDIKYTHRYKLPNCHDLPAEVVDAPTLNAFKNRLDRFWMNHELKYDYKVSIKIDL